MKFKEIAEMSNDELQTKKRDMRQESLHLRLQQQSGQIEQPSRLRLLRRDVARIETVLSGRDKEPVKKELWPSKSKHQLCHRPLPPERRRLRLRKTAARARRAREK